MSRADLLEQLAEREHQQWIDWTAWMLDNLTPENIRRWRRQIETPYQNLSEHEKESDRTEARKVLAIIEEELAELTGAAVAKLMMAILLQRV